MNDDRDWELEYQRVVNEGLVPKVEGSVVCVSLVPKDGLDAKFAVELGVMILLDKPILVIVGTGVTVSEKLRLVADKIVEGDIANPQDTERIQEAIRVFADAHGIEHD